MAKIKNEPIPYALARLPVRALWRKGRGLRPAALTCHDAMELQFIKQGHGAYVIAGRTCNFKARSLLVIQPGAPHVFAPAPGVLVEKGTLLLHPARFIGRRLLRHLSRMPRHLSLSARASAQFELIFRQLVDEQRLRHLRWAELCALKIREIFLLMERAGHGRAGVEPVAVHPVMQPMLAYIESHYQRPLLMADLAEHMGFSASHLAHLCQRHLGLGLRQYVLQRRVLEAQRLLEHEPHLKVKAVAERVGFEEFSAFNRVFKKRTGFTPATYRQLLPNRHSTPCQAGL